MKTKITLLLSFVFLLGSTSFAQTSFEQRYQEELKKDKLGMVLSDTKAEIVELLFNPSTCAEKVDEPSFKKITLEKDKVLLIKVKGTPSSGYRWIVTDLQSDVLKLVAEKPEPGLGPGAIINERFVMVGLAEGVGQFKLEYKRPWENKAPLKEYIFQVTSEGEFTGTFEVAEDVLPPKAKLTKEDITTKALPAYYSLADQGYVTSPKDQGSTNGCWAFGSAGSFESVVLKSTGNTIDISEQWLCNCNSYGFSCVNGGWFAAYMFQDYGAVYESQVPFYSSGYDGTCYSYTYYEQASAWGYTDGVSDSPWPNYSHNASITQIKQAIYDHGALAANLYVGNSWYSYTGGILTTNDGTAGHIVTLVGWDDYNNCWIIKNSWGTGWGEGGYCRSDYSLTATNVGGYSTWIDIGGSTTTCDIPTGLSETSITSNSARLNWNHSSGAADYTVAYRVSGVTTWTNATTSSNYYDLTGLSANTTYEWGVEANCSGGGVSGFTAMYSFTTGGGTTCSVPTGLTESNITSNSARLNWDYSSGAADYTVAYRESGVTTWTNATTSSNYFDLSGLSANTTYEWGIEANCSGGGVSGFSAMNTFTTTGSTSNYCTSQGNDFSYEWISSVQIGSFNNSSSAAGYTDFTNQTVSVNSGANSVTLTPGFSGSSYSEYWKIWIDLNQNSTFDSNEEVFSGNGSSTVSGNMNVPSGYSGVTTRMRVTMKYNSNPTACETFSYGEVEDYTVTIGGSTQDTDPPTTPTGLSSNGVTESTVNLSWNASSDNVGVTGYDVYHGSSVVGTSSSTSFTVTGLSPNTSYTFSVRARDAANNVSGASNSVSVTTLDNSNPVSYCSATYSNPIYYFYIDNVSFGSINNSTTLGNSSTGYSDYTNISTSVVAGSSYTLSVDWTPNWSANSCKVYIDWNQDGDFIDSGEEVMNASGSSVPYSASVYVPSTATTGNTRMRVRLTYSSSITACGELTYGETEDYTVSIAPGTPNPISEEFGVEIYPNPVSSHFNVTITGAQEATVQIISLNGQLVAQEKITNSSGMVDVNEVASGMYYVRVISDENSAVEKIVVK